MTLIQTKNYGKRDPKGLHRIGSIVGRNVSRFFLNYFLATRWTKILLGSFYREISLKIPRG